MRGSDLEPRVRSNAPVTRAAAAAAASVSGNEVGSGSGQTNTGGTRVGGGQSSTSSGGRGGAGSGGGECDGSGSGGRAVGPSTRSTRSTVAAPASANVMSMSATRSSVNNVSENASSSSTSFTTANGVMSHQHNNRNHHNNNPSTSASMNLIGQSLSTASSASTLRITDGPKTPPRVGTPRARDTIGGPDPDYLRKALDGTLGSLMNSNTPAPSPKRKRSRVYGDRFIPNREGVDLRAGYQLIQTADSPMSPTKPKKKVVSGELQHQKAEEANRTFTALLRTELFHDTVPQANPYHLSARRNDPRAHTPPPSGNPTSIPSTPSKNLYTYMSPQTRTPHSKHGPILDTRSEIYSLTPVRLDSQRLLLSPRKQPRTVSKTPFKVLDAPELADDFYLNLVDWGSQNILGVGLGSSVYMWNATTLRVVKLCDLGEDLVTSVSWISRGSHLAIGTNKGYVQIWDADKCRRLRTMTGHTARVGALAWNDHILSSGSRDRSIYHRDVRSPDQFHTKLTGHKQEVCGLKWNVEDGQLASGGNDNKLFVWDKLSPNPLFKFSDHTAAVKAIAWSPHQHGTLASGGGTADKKIRFWNTLNGESINEIDTGSQVCNLAWSKNSNEIVSTHGYSENQIVVWKYPSMTQVASLTGHTCRVLYLAMSPNGEVIVTGAGDETLRFWNCFSKGKNHRKLSTVLDPFDQIR